MVYVDPIMRCLRNARWPYNEACHLFADTVEELHDFAINKLGLQKEWFQLGGNKTFPHYDLTRSKRDLAVKNGAKEIERRDVVNKWIELGFIPNVKMGLRRD